MLDFEILYILALVRHAPLSATVPCRIFPISVCSTFKCFLHHSTSNRRNLHKNSQIYIYIYVANCANACKWMQSASNCSLSAITNHLTTSITNHLTSRLLVCAQNPCWHWRWIRRRVKHRSMYTMITFNLLVLEIVLHEVRHVANVPTTNGKWATSPLVLTSCSLANLRIFFPARVYPTNPRLNQAQVQCLSSMS